MIIVYSGIHRKAHNFLKQSQSSSANGKKCIISVNMSPLSDFFERVKSYD